MNSLTASPAISLLVPLVLVATSAAHDGDWNDASLTKYQSRDGKNIWTDKATGLDWLDLDATTNISKKDMKARLGKGELAGFRYATLAEVGTLYLHLGFTVGRQYPETESLAAGELPLKSGTWYYLGDSGKAPLKNSPRDHLGYTEHHISQTEPGVSGHYNFHSTTGIVKEELKGYEYEEWSKKVKKIKDYKGSNDKDTLVLTVEFRESWYFPKGSKKPTYYSGTAIYANDPTLIRVSDKKSDRHSQEFTTEFDPLTASHKPVYIMYERSSDPHPLRGSYIVRNHK